MSGRRGNYGPNRSHRPSSSTVPRKRTADEQEDEWVAQEDKFVLRQAKRKAILRVRGGRAKPIDWLAVMLHVIDTSDDFFDDDEEKGELNMVDPEGVMQGLSKNELEDLERDIDTYLIREVLHNNKEFWNVRHLFHCESC
jgi:Conserved mid region of cactin